MRRAVLLAAMLAVAGPCFAQLDSDVQYRVTVLTAKDARPQQAAEPKRIVRELGQVLTFLHLSPQRLPNSVGVFAAPHDGELEGFPADATVTVARVSIGSSMVYQVWVTGTPSDGNTVQGLIWVLNRHFDLKLSTDSIVDIRDRVVRQMTQVVSVEALAHH